MRQYTVICNSQPMKIGGLRECEDYVQMQLKKVKGGGLAEGKNDNPAWAAGQQWGVRPYRSGDDEALEGGR